MSSDSKEVIISNIIKLPDENIIVLPRCALSFLKNASDIELRVLILSFASKGFFVADIAKELGVSVSEVERAAAFWAGAGVFVFENEGKKRYAGQINLYQTYDSEIISRATEENDDFKSMCEAVGGFFERLLNKNDYNSLFYLYDYVGLSSDYICAVADYCVREKKHSMQYFMKTALGMFDDGIDDYEKLEAYLAKKEKSRTSINRLRTLCGLGERALTQKEKELFECWFTAWDMPFELITLAYEKTVDATGRVQFSYMNKILKSWNDSGFSTLEDISSGDKKDKGESSFDADEFFAAASKRSMKKGKSSSDEHDSNEQED